MMITIITTIRPITIYFSLPWPAKGTPFHWLGRWWKLHRLVDCYDYQQSWFFIQMMFLFIRRPEDSFMTFSLFSSSDLCNYQVNSLTEILINIATAKWNISGQHDPRQLSKFAESTDAVPLPDGTERDRTTPSEVKRPQHRTRFNNIPPQDASTC